MLDDFEKGSLTFRRFLTFWSPLAVTWILMAAEGPFLAAVIARLAEPKVNLAAFGVAFGLVILIESPIIMLLSASNALVRDEHSYLKLRQFSYGLCGFITILMVLLTQTPLCDWITLDLMGLPADVARLAHGGLTLLIPWPGLVGVRRFYQGMLIKAGLTSRVAWGTVVRISCIGISGLALYSLSDWPGVWVGDFSMTIGVGGEALFSALVCQKTVRSIRQLGSGPTASAPLTLKGIAVFYYPLALTSLVSFMTTSITSFFLSHAREPMNSLAVMPVVNSTVFLFNGIGVSMQEASVALVGARSDWVPAIRRHGYVVSGISSALLYLMLLTPLRYLWFGTMGGLSEELVEFALWPALLMGILPVLTAWMSIQRGILVVARLTGSVRDATFVEVASTLGLMWLCLHPFGWVGAVGAGFASIAGRTLGNLYLVRPTARGLGVLRSRAAGADRSKE